MSAMASQITSLTIVYSTFHSDSDADQGKHRSSASLAFVWGIHRWPVNSPHKWPVTRNFFSIWWRHHVTEKGITRQCAYLEVFACHHDTMLILHTTQRGHLIIGHNKHPCRISFYLTTVWRKIIISIFVITDTRTNDITSLDGYKLW